MKLVDKDVWTLGWLLLQAAPPSGGDALQMSDYSSGQAIKIQLPNGNIMNIPVDSAKQINISEELNRSGAWQTVNCNNQLENASEKTELTCRNNRRRSK